MQPHPFAIGDVSERADIIDRASIGRAEDAHNAHWADAVLFIVGNRLLQSIKTNLEFRVGRQST
jgi:hypothetical protein